MSSYPAPPPVPAFPGAPTAPPAAPPAMPPAMPPPPVPAMPPPPMANPAGPALGAVAPTPGAAFVPGQVVTPAAPAAGYVAPSYHDPEFLAYLKAEAARAEAKPTWHTGGGDAWDWFKPEAPEVVGAAKDYFILWMPIAQGIGKFNVPVLKRVVHKKWVKGASLNVLCPREDAILNGVDPSLAPACLVCQERDRLYETARKYPRDSAENKAWFERVKEIQTRESEVIAVFDLQNAQSHCKVENGVTVISAKPYEIPKSKWAELMRFTANLPLLWGPNTHTPIQITATRKGKEKKEVTYDFSPVQLQVGQGRVPPGYESIYSTLLDLTVLRSPPTESDITRFIGGSVEDAPSAPVPSAAPPSPYPAAAPPPPPPPVARPRQEANGRVYEWDGAQWHDLGLAAAPPPPPPPVAVAPPPVAAPPPPVPASPIAPPVAGYPMPGALPTPPMPAAPPVAAVPYTAAPPPGAPPVPSLPNFPPPPR